MCALYLQCFSQMDESKSESVLFDWLLDVRIDMIDCLIVCGCSYFFLVPLSDFSMTTLTYLSRDV